MFMRSIATILLLLLGAFCAIYALSGLTVTVMRLAEWVSEGDWSRIAKVTLALAVSVALAWYSLRASWRRREDVLNLGSRLRTLLRKFPRVSLTVFLGMVAASLGVTALIVAFVVNPIELPDFIGSDILSWDPTRTARKYVWLSVMLIAGAYLVSRYVRNQLAIAVIPALMLTLALPIGVASYEYLRDRWSFIYWIAGYGDNIEALRKDPYVYLPDGGSSMPYTVRISQDSLAALQFLRATGASGDWSELEEAEAEEAAAVISRRKSGYGLLVVFFALVGGSGWLIYRDRASADNEPGALA